MRTLLVALLVVQPCLALAQPTSSPTSQSALLSLPKGTRLKTPQGTFHGYSLPEMKVILKIEASYRSWGAQLPKYRRKISNYKKLEEAQDKQAKLLENQVSILQKEHVRLTKKWTEENRLRHLCENKPNFGSWVSWSIAATMAATAAVLAGILISKD